jgi:hypothetical protein
MQCRTCGTEIADKAIVCYRCGAATTDPVRKAVPLKGARGGPSLLSGIAILVVALIMLAFARVSGYPQIMNAGAILFALAGAVLLGTRLLRRR